MQDHGNDAQQIKHICQSPSWAPVCKLGNFKLAFVSEMPADLLLTSGLPKTKIVGLTDRRNILLGCWAENVIDHPLAQNRQEIHRHSGIHGLMN